MALTRYAELRNQLMRLALSGAGAPAVLRDADNDYVPIPISERLVQCLWYDQRIRTDGLRTADGRPVRVTFPGWWNLEAGPDFRHATIQIGDEAECTGDVEIHLRAEDWMHHGHGRDPLYNDVILHVVLWESPSPVAVRTRAGEILPQLVLQNQLAAPLESLYDEIDPDAYPHNARGHGGNCARTLQELDGDSVGALLEAAGDERFAAKARKYFRWIHRAGPEQAFYEGWMEALGYKANKTGFRALAQALPLSAWEGERRKEMAAMMFGVANFLPTVLPKSKDPHIKRLWKAWWKLRPEFEDRILPVGRWKFHGVRPANHPHRRLGAAVALLRKHRDLLEKVMGAIESGGDPAKLFLQVSDPYWNVHFTLGGRIQARALELIGQSRAEEIAANVLLPFAAAMAERDGDGALRAAVQARYAGLRPGPANSALRLAGRQLFDATPRSLRFINSARRQQGLLQVFHDFCLNDKSACQQCQFPELVKRWKADAAAVTSACR